MSPNPSVSLEGLLLTGVCFASPRMPAVCLGDGGGSWLELWEWGWVGAGREGGGDPGPAGRAWGDAGSCPWGEKAARGIAWVRTCPGGGDLAHPRASECHQAVGFRSLKAFCSFCRGHPWGLVHTMSFFPLLGLKCYSMKWKKVQDPALSLLLPRAELCCPNGEKKNIKIPLIVTEWKGEKDGQHQQKEKVWMRRRGRR